MSVDWEGYKGTIPPPLPLPSPPPQSTPSLSPPISSSSSSSSSPYLTLMPCGGNDGAADLRVFLAPLQG